MHFSVNFQHCRSPQPLYILWNPLSPKAGVLSMTRTAETLDQSTRLTLIVVGSCAASSQIGPTNQSVNNTRSKVLQVPALGPWRTKWRGNVVHLGKVHRNCVPILHYYFATGGKIEDLYGKRTYEASASAVKVVKRSSSRTCNVSYQIALSLIFPHYLKNWHKTFNFSIRVYRCNFCPQFFWFLNEIRRKINNIFSAKFPKFSW